MARHEHFYLDKESLKTLLRLIKGHYSSKEDLETEVTGIESQLEELSTGLATEVSERQSLASSVYLTLSEEVTARETGDENVQNTLTQLVTNKITERISAEEQLQSNIDSIYKNDGSTESGTLVEKMAEQTQYTDEKSNVLINQIDSVAELLNEEKQARLSVDTDLDTRVTSLENQHVTVETDTEMSDSSENPVQNKVIKSYIDNKAVSIRFKGYAEDWEDLQAKIQEEGLSVGDVWTVESEVTLKGVTYPPNSNFVYDGRLWFNIGASISLTDYYTKNAIDQLLRDKVGHAYIDSTTGELVLTSNDGTSSKEIARLPVGGGGGSDPALRAEFEAFRDLATNEINTLSDEADEHREAINPHNITKETIGLDKVLNYSPTEIIAPVVEVLEDKVNRDELSEELEAKVSVTDIIDDLEHAVSDAPLSANQGVELDNKISSVKSDIARLGGGLIFKGTVDSYESLPQDAQTGECYQIYSNSQDPHHGEVYAMADNGEWTQIVASAQDLSALIASPADINSIIENYS